MTLFPFFRNIEGAYGIITGGGKHALEKIEKLMPYGPQLYIFSEEFCEAIMQMLQQEYVSGRDCADKREERSVHLIDRKLQEQDLEKVPAFVIAAGDDEQENHQIAEWCRKRRIPVNVVDDQDYCDFIFPSLIARGNLSIGICTNGASPASGVLLKKRIEEQIPVHMEEILDFLQEKRPVIRQSFPDKKKRFAFYHQLSKLCMEQDRILSEEEFFELTARYQ